MGNSKSSSSKINNGLKDSENKIHFKSCDPALHPNPSAAHDSIHKLKDLNLWPCGTPKDSGKSPSENELHEKKGPLAKTRWVHISNARLITYEPGVPCNGIALLIIAGGGYSAIMERESATPAQHFASKGYYTFELIYRLPKSDETGYRLAPFQDAHRAIKCIRNYGLKTGLFSKVGGIGFSAGKFNFYITFKSDGRN
jgi:hypothetical protein